jgi:hypothetical protein
MLTVSILQLKDIDWWIGFKKKTHPTGRVTHEVEHLTSKWEALSLNPSAVPNKNFKKNVLWCF